MVLLLTGPHTSHITQGEDIVNFLNLKGAVSMQTQKALPLKFWLQAQPQKVETEVGAVPIAHNLDRIVWQLYSN